VTFTLLPDGRAHWDLREERWQWTPDPESTAVLTTPDGVPVSVCRLFPRRLESFDCALDVYGVGGVYTHPAHRGRGYGTSLLTHLRAHSWPRKLALVLYAGNRALYTRAGFTWLQSAKEHQQLLATPLVDGLTFTAESRLESRPWQVWPEGHF